MPSKNFHDLHWDEAAQFLRDEIIPRFATVGTFARIEGLADTTVRDILSGRYNRTHDDIGMSPAILFYFCRKITGGDVLQAQFLVAQYLMILGVIPRDAELPLLAKITRVEDLLRSTKQTLLGRARKKRTERRTRSHAVPEGETVVAKALSAPRRDER